jgi:hypothetical protein
MGRIRLWHPLVLQWRHVVSASLYIDALIGEAGQDRASITDSICHALLHQTPHLWPDKPARVFDAETRRSRCEAGIAMPRYRRV